MSPQQQQQHVYRVVIVGARHRKDNTDADTLGKLFTQLTNKFGRNYIVATMGCDVGIGELIRSTCINRQIPWLEYACHFSPILNQLYHEVAIMTRHAALIEFGETFYAFAGSSLMTSVEDLVERVKAAGLPIRVYGQLGAIREQHGQDNIKPRSF